MFKSLADGKPVRDWVQVSFNGHDASTYIDPVEIFVDGVQQVVSYVDQNTNPDDFYDEGYNWERFGTVHLNTGQVLSVELSTVGTTDYVLADAVYARRSTTPEVEVFDGSWHMVTITYDGTSVRGYVDGVPGSKSGRPEFADATGMITVGGTSAWNRPSSGTVIAYSESTSSRKASNSSSARSISSMSSTGAGG